MGKTHPGYPFLPRSTSYLQPGDFWSVPLSDGRFACGRVLDTKATAGPDDHDDLGLSLSTRVFFLGLMDWVGEVAPSTDSLAGAALLRQGAAHILTITTTGGEILGNRDLALDGITGLIQASHKTGGTVWLYRGARRLRPATREEATRGPWISHWGFKVITVTAEAHFVQGRPWVPDTMPIVD